MAKNLTNVSAGDDINATDHNDAVSDVGFLYPEGGDSSDGVLNVAAGTTTLNTNQVYNYSSITVSAGATLAFTGDNGPALLNCSGNATIAGTIELRNIVDTPFGTRTSKGDHAETGSARIDFTGAAGGTGGTANGGGGDGGDGGDGDAASGTPGTGGAGGAAGGGGRGECRGGGGRRRWRWL